MGGVVMADKFEDVVFKLGDTPIFGIADWSDMGRKKPVLWIQTDECNRVKVASFNSAEAARMFINIFAALLKRGANEKP